MARTWGEGKKKSLNGALQNGHATSTPVGSRFLAPQDLAEFRLRVATLREAENNAKMVREAYQYYVIGLREKYQIGSKKYDIDPTSGLITEVANG